MIILKTLGFILLVPAFLVASLLAGAGMLSLIAVVGTAVLSVIVVCLVFALSTLPLLGLVFLVISTLP